MGDKKVDEQALPSGVNKRFVSVILGGHREKMLQLITDQPLETHAPVVAERYGRDLSTSPQSLREGLSFVPKQRVSDLGVDAVEGIPEP
jgi:hypothetical protein